MRRLIRVLCVASALSPWLACTPQAPAPAPASTPESSGAPESPPRPEPPLEGSTEQVIEPTIEPVGGGSGEPSVRVVEGSALPPAPAEQATLTRRFVIPAGLTALECGGAPALRCLASSSTGSVMLAWASEGQAEPAQVALDEPAQRMLPLGDTGWVAITQQAATMADPAAASTTLRWTCDGSTVRQQRWDRALVDVQRLSTGVALLLGGSEPELVWVPASCGDPVATTLSARSVTALRASADGTAVAVTGLRTSTLEVVSLASGSPAAPVEVALPFQPYLLAARDDGRWATLPPNAQEGVWVSLASDAEVTMQPLWLPHPLEHVESCGMYWAGWDAATESAWLAGWEPLMEPLVLEGVTDASMIHCTGDGEVAMLAGSQAIFVEVAEGASPVRVDGVSVVWTEAGARNVVRGDAIYSVTLP